MASLSHTEWCWNRVIAACQHYGRVVVLLRHQWWYEAATHSFLCPRIPCVLTNWMSCVGEKVTAAQEPGNKHDRCTIALPNSEYQLWPEYLANCFKSCVIILMLHHRLDSQMLLCRIAKNFLEWHITIVPTVLRKEKQLEAVNEFANGGTFSRALEVSVLLLATIRGSCYHRRLLATIGGSCYHACIWVLKQTAMVTNDSKA